MKTRRLGRLAAASLMALAFGCGAGCASILGISDVPEPDDAGPEGRQDVEPAAEADAEPRDSGKATGDAGGDSSVVNKCEFSGPPDASAGVLCGQKRCGEGESCCTSGGGSCISPPVPCGELWACEGKAQCPAPTNVCCAKISVSAGAGCSLTHEASPTFVSACFDAGTGDCRQGEQRLCRGDGECPAGQSCRTLTVDAPSSYIEGDVGVCRVKASPP